MIALYHDFVFARRTVVHMNASASPIDGEISRFMNFSLDDQRRYRRKLLLATVIGSLFLVLPLCVGALRPPVAEGAWASVIALTVGMMMIGAALIIGAVYTAANRDAGLAPNVVLLSEARRRELTRRIAANPAVEIAALRAASESATKRARTRCWLVSTVMIVPLVGCGLVAVSLLSPTHAAPIAITTLLFAPYLSIMPLVVVIAKTYEAASQKTKMLDEARALAEHPATSVAPAI